MPDTPQPFTNAYTKLAHTAILAAAHGEHDFVSWLTRVLADVADELGSTDTLDAERIEPRETDLPQRPVNGTIRLGDDYLEQCGEHVS